MLHCYGWLLSSLSWTSAENFHAGTVMKYTKVTSYIGIHNIKITFTTKTTNTAMYWYIFILGRPFKHVNYCTSIQDDVHRSMW